MNIEHAKPRVPRTAVADMLNRMCTVFNHLLCDDTAGNQTPFKKVVLLRNGCEFHPFLFVPFSDKVRSEARL